MSSLNLDDSIPLLVGRDSLTPYKYPESMEFYKKQTEARWEAHDISYSRDILQWVSLDPDIKRIIAGVLRGFVQTELIVHEYWSTNVGRWFPHPDIKLMATRLGDMEGVHAISYNQLSVSLGLNSYEAFKSDPSALAKIGFLIETPANSVPEIARSLAVFSAFTEGVILFSSFAILQWLKTKSLLPGLTSVIEYSVRDECCSADTEVLTPAGWVEFQHLNPTDKIAQFDPTTKEISFVVPSRIVCNEVNEKLIEFGGEKFPYRAKVTKNHRMLTRLDKIDKYKFVYADNVKPHPKLMVPVAGQAAGVKTELSDYERFLIVLQADGFLSERYTGAISGCRPVNFSFAKKRKIDRFTALLDRLGFTYKLTIDPERGKRSEQQKFKVDVPIDNILSKTFDWLDLSEISAAWASEFIEEISHWDGHLPKDIYVNSGKYIYYSSTIKANVDIVQAVASLCGKNATVSVQVDNRQETFSDVYRCYIHNKQEKRMGKVTKTEIDYCGKVYCATVPSGALVIRYQDSVSITGNCLHSEAGCWLFCKLLEEAPTLNTPELWQEIEAGAEASITLEHTFIDSVFQNTTLDGLDPSDLKQFIIYRVNLKLAEIGSKKVFALDQAAADRINSWFDLYNGVAPLTDNFVRRPTAYTKGVFNIAPASLSFV
jgi:ribonucleotide reductase beta subunit family protein with ferritin-like domain